ncbi:hypothetical protein Q2T40_12470 [Winogradskyella maritima]|uniref:Uncharacterized protein n=1 Tax=Winogradskyella maritima TaxID=1517766 RepID=A0ABV8AKW5_9FLAO|nr:hypothetical protein [Winogradskyella maritima]
MTYLIIGILISFILYPIFSAKAQLDKDNKEKPYTTVTILMAMAIFLSIILSIAIALNADMPASIGHGGFMYIIGPGFYGILVLILYLVSVGVRPEWKFVSGLACILINISIGFYYFI